MVSDIAAILRGRRDLGHLTVTRLSDGRWQAGFRREGQKEYIVGTDEDIVKAIEIAVLPSSWAEVDRWLGTLNAAEKKRKKPYPMETTTELVEKLPESVKNGKKYDDLI